MAARMKAVSGLAKDLFGAYKKTPQGGTDKSDVNSNEKLKKAPYGSSGMSAVQSIVSAMIPEGAVSKGPKGSTKGVGRNMGGNGKGKFPNMLKDMK